MEKLKRKKQRTKAQKQMVLLCWLLGCLLVIGSFTGTLACWRFGMVELPWLDGSAQEPVQEEPEEQEELPLEEDTEIVELVPADMAVLPSNELPDDIQDWQWNTRQPVERTINPAVENTDFRLMSVPESEPVDPSWFDTVTFVGDSITQGLAIYETGLPNAHFCAYKNSGPNSIVNRGTLHNVDGTDEIAIDALVEAQPTAVYVMMGMNSLRGGGDSSYFNYYSAMLDMFREALGPDVPIYVESMTPTTASTGAQRPSLSSEYVFDINNLLATLAKEKGCYFIDLYDALLDETGHMNPDYAAKDGIHMNPSGYAVWVDYLCRHVAR